MRASILLMLTVLFAGTAWSQGKVTGKVTDRASGEALPGVAVVVSGSGSGVFTGADGAYSISANAASDKLVFTFIGYDSETIEIGGQASINVALISRCRLGRGGRHSTWGFAGKESPRVILSKSSEMSAFTEAKSKTLSSL